jgi:hypothetical protein
MAEHDGVRQIDANISLQRRHEVHQERFMLQYGFAFIASDS